ncbi:hypothetical protein [Rhodococcoides fascians]|uniref:hypothetical protein n=1 Tax=Rhodococcoides fascians TaxID=1828 RepID=UPI00050C7B34|nr:hypothetical protein [Rhodococcus fascians]
MAFQYRPDRFPTFPVEIYAAGSEDATVYELPTLGYVPKEIHESVDEVITTRINEVQKRRDDRQKKHQPLPSSDRSIAYPTDIDVLDELLQRLAPELAAEVEKWPLRPREDLWIQWSEASKPADLEKSEASSTSSDEKA